MSGAAQDLCNQAVDSASQTAGSFERALRNTIENQPHTAAAIALALGWLLGRKSRSRKSAQCDKWSFCLTAGTLWPANQERP